MDANKTFHDELDEAFFFINKVSPLYFKRNKAPSLIKILGHAK